MILAVGFREDCGGFPGGAVVKNLPANAGDTGDAASVLGLGRSPGVGDSNPLQCSFLENAMDRGAMDYSPRGHKELEMTE